MNNRQGHGHGEKNQAATAIVTFANWRAGQDSNLRPPAEKICDHAASDVDDPRFHQPRIVVEARDDGQRDGAGLEIRDEHLARREELALVDDVKKFTAFFFPLDVPEERNRGEFRHELQRPFCLTDQRHSSSARSSQRSLTQMLLAPGR
jgi:hypothetical protein